MLSEAIAFDAMESGPKPGQTKIAIPSESERIVLLPPSPRNRSPRFLPAESSYNGTVKAIFFDRDGVVNQRRVDDYVKNWEEFHFLPDIFEVLPDVHRAGWTTVLVTNQRGIGRGLMSGADLENVHRRMQEELTRRIGRGFDAIYHCPHDIGDNCDCRKPLPGMLVQAGVDLGLSLPDSWMIGDSESDIRAGLAAGCHTARIIANGETSRAEIIGGSLLEVWERIRAVVGGPTVRG
jgi:D-glycero-D-manno-heptose 1,7-bisphosphate phosphatase